MKRALVLIFPLVVWTSQAFAAECVESVPRGGERPRTSEFFPLRGTAGHAVALGITVVHGKGERVLPAGFAGSELTEARKILKSAGFALPSQNGTGAARVLPLADEANGSAKTQVELLLVPLPPEPGRQVLRLPSLPLAIARANGEITTVCTQTHDILVEDPTASTPEAAPRPNAPPLPQREEFTALKKALLYGSLGLLAGALLAWAVRRFLSRPKAVPPPPPPRPPWEVALEKLAATGRADLVATGRKAEHVDRVSDAVREYLGARFGFDGLESTTDEIMAALRTRGQDVLAERPDDGTTRATLRDVQQFLAASDLVKFANLDPSEGECARTLAEGERLVRATMPRDRVDQVLREEVRE